MYAKRTRLGRRDFIWAISWTSRGLFVVANQLHHHKSESGDAFAPLDDGLYTRFEVLKCTCEVLARRQEGVDRV